MSTKFIFATRSDCERGIRKVEAEANLKYVPEDSYSSREYEVYYSALDIPQYCVAVYGHFNSDPHYLVCPIETEINVREIHLNSGGIQYKVDCIHNNAAFRYTPGGLYNASTLVGGSLVSNSLIPEVRKLCFNFGRILTHSFVKILDDEYENWYVGPEALTLLRQGARLVTDTLKPLEFPDSLKL